MNSIEKAIAQIRNGGMVVVTDDENRENEGDLIAAASTITAETIAFMAKEGSGLICLALTAEQLDRLHLPLMVASTDNTEQQRTAFTISIDAASGVTTGISAADRARTILMACDPHATGKDLNRPGHIPTTSLCQWGFRTSRPYRGSGGSGSIGGVAGSGCNL